MVATEKIPNSREGVERFAFRNDLKLVFATGADQLIGLLERQGEDLGPRIKREMKILDQIVLNNVWGAGNLKTRHVMIVDHLDRDWSDYHYATVLHEMGHVLLPASRRDELMAWAWAMLHAVEWTPAMHRHMTDALRSYSIEFDKVAAA